MPLAGSDTSADVSVMARNDAPDHEDDDVLLLLRVILVILKSSILKVYAGMELG